MKVIKRFRVITAALLAAWMILIFCLSAQNAELSSETSGGVIEFLVKLLYSDFSSLGEAAQNEIISSFQFIVRKLAHFSLYGVLGILSYLSVVSYRSIQFGNRIILSSGICLAYAVSDEIHQLFVAGRSCEFRDVCIDFIGSLLMIIILALFSRYIKRIYKHIN